MSKQLLILPCIFISTYIYTMQSPCWFNNMPTDVLTHIASFLTFYDRETEQEFIERTKTIKKQTLPNSCLNRLPKEYGDEKKTLIASCPNNMIYALCYNGNKNDPNPHSALLIFDTKNDAQLYGHIDCDIKNYEKLAVSHKGDMFATIRLQHKETAYEGNAYTYSNKKKITIKNRITQKTEIVNIPRFFMISDESVLAFHKEGTHIIIHGINQIFLKNFIIFPLTVNTPPQNPDNKKTLEKYFEQCMICKNFSKQISH